MEKLTLKYRDLSCFCGDPRGSCECHSPVPHSFLTTINTNEKQPNKQINSEQKKELNNSRNSKKTLRRRISSSTEEDESDDNIEYAESDASVSFSGGSISSDINDNENHMITELDETTGVLRPKIDPKKKVTLLSTIIVKKPNAEYNIEEERKRKIICENKFLMHKRFRENTIYITGQDEVTKLSQIRKKPENTASYDLRESILFGNEVSIKELRPNSNCDIIKTDNREIDENKENKNNTKEQINKTLQEKFVIDKKHKTELKCTKTDESKGILNVVGEQERREFYENINNDTIEIEYKKPLESVGGQDNTSEDLQDLNKYEALDKTDLNQINEFENFKEIASDKDLNINNEEEGGKTTESEENLQNFILNENDSVIVRYL